MRFMKHLICIFFLIIQMTAYGQSKMPDGKHIQKHYNGSLYSETEYLNGLKNGWHHYYEMEGNRKSRFYRLDTLIDYFEIDATGDTLVRDTHIYLHDANGRLLIHEVNDIRKRKQILLKQRTVFAYSGKDSIRFESDSAMRLRITYHKDSAHFTCLDSGESVRFKDGDTGLSYFLSETLMYPKNARSKDQTGIVIVQFIIKSDGSIKDVKASGQRTYPELEAEAIRVIKLTAGNWIPASACGKTISTVARIPITFEIEDE